MRRCTKVQAQHQTIDKREANLEKAQGDYDPGRREAIESRQAYTKICVERDELKHKLSRLTAGQVKREPTD